MDAILEKALGPRSSFSCYYSLFKCKWRNESTSRKGQGTRREMVSNSQAICRCISSWLCLIGLVSGLPLWASDLLCLAHCLVSKNVSVEHCFHKARL